MKHAPIGPTMALPMYRAGRHGYIHTHNQNPQALRGEIAQMLGDPATRSSCALPGPGHYGRSNGGNAGAEDEAVMLSKDRAPVRVQWMRPEDFQWSTQSPAALSDVQIALDENGRIAAYQVDHYMPAMQDDRPIGAVLAGLPTMAAPSEKGDMVGNYSSTIIRIRGSTTASRTCSNNGHGTYQVGQKSRPSPSGSATTACARPDSSSRTSRAS